MKTLKEVCEIVGVTRRTLQEYDAIGLMHPTSKTESGYWLYDEDAIESLVIIRALSETGMTRRKIMELFNWEEIDSLEALGDRLKYVISFMEEKYRRIDGCLTVLRAFESTIKLPESTLQSVFENAESFWTTSHEGSYLDAYHDLIEKASEYNFSFEESAALIRVSIDASAISMMVGRPLDDPHLDLCVRKLCEDYLCILASSQCKETVINALDEGKRVDEFLIGALKASVKGAMYKYDVDEKEKKTMEYIIEAVESYGSRLTQADSDMWRQKWEEALKTS